MIKKKFRVRLKYFTDCKYYVEYANYYIFPIWKPIIRWTNSILGFSERLFDFKGAEEYAAKIKSMDDVERIHDAEEEIYQKEKESRERYYKGNAPYKVKYF